MVLICIGMMSTVHVTAGQSIEGVWLSQKHKKKVVIDVGRSSIYVRGVHPTYEKGHKFYKSSRSKYRDNYGNLLKIEGQDHIEIKYADTWKRIDYYRVSDQIPNTRRSKPSVYNRNDYNDNYNDRNRSLSSLEGTWYNQRLNQDVYIIADRYGIKATIRKGEWIYFEQIDQYNFKDNRGNTYKINRDGSMTWSSYDCVRTYNIRKTSDYIPF